MKVLITGGTGFLGRRLAERLCAQGYDVTASGRNADVGKKLDKSGIRFVEADLRDQSRIHDCCKGQEYIFHCGALSSPWGKYQDFYETNVLGTRNIITGCMKYSARRLIHVSTPSIYFEYKDRFEVHESDRLPEQPVNNYAKSKLLAETEVDKAFAEGFPVITIRPRALFGPGDSSIIPRLINANKKFGIPVIDGGNALIDITYVDNAVDALLLCKDAPDAAMGQKYNITNGEPKRLIDILSLLFEKMGCEFRQKRISFNKAYSLAAVMELLSKTILLGKEPVLTKYTVGVLSKSQTLDIGAARKNIGYDPRISIEQGLEHYIEWRRINNIDH